jgi:hypothetical protein
MSSRLRVLRYDEHSAFAGLRDIHPKENQPMTDESTTEESLTLAPKFHDKLGAVHCGVTREGFIAVGGDPREIADGEEIVFERTRIRVRRQGSEYTFSRSA